ncbi:copper resistance protein NlpE [Photobacterium sanctipauli]|uniref:Copper resistance protein NlpE n=1 Tax=Photobacterium sanctipauli TaxID=1342794 RepID=A0A2T3NWY8_9GAMM|nr:copper resistance protein NlpE [Photobacterium sanctipauli]PSW20813.1 copper resistance protein NlpE [Photobacterium sanctipauli]
MKKTLLTLILAGVVLTGCDQSSTPETTTAPESDTAPAAQLEVQPEQLPEVEQPVVEQPIADTAHNARNALDWNGTYTGILPCASCEGIRTELNIQTDGTFTLTEVYLGEENGTFEQEGTFNWNSAGNTIALVGGRDSAVQYFVAENQLFRLDREGNRITGDLAEHYVLKKQ